VQIHHLHVNILETVLLKAAALMSWGSNDDTAAIDTLCKVSRCWWIVLWNSRRRKRGRHVSTLH